MRWIAGSLCVAALLLGGYASATDTQQKAQAAENKAEVLEEKAARDEPPTSGKTAPITPSEAQAVDPAGEAPLDDAITCLARSIYWEAKGEPPHEMEAVANVVMNRLASDDFPDTVCAVVKQGSETKSCQFSWWCDGRPDEVVEEDRYELATEIARKALNGQLKDRTGGALYFHDRDVSPDWAHEYVETAQTRRFLFYTPSPAAKPRAGTDD
ncbi:cell wall hydrolase [Pseudomonas sp. JS3066]|jgi:spore germination cell wall hydrolase CwlJ-like protein|uniref:cell wall hydrolase n=1 Tax=unclassified Pseudomonas TaxID=196821 RepID=UPI00129E488B|nr:MULTISPECIES: cell wall hydrolase [unclassified Pseudomonas]MDH4654831.1 cell wall hydrolase [Pseudomonas sp. BN606]MRK23785.1 cell wall hydrolase [Pseudomonas sp. JG-B]WVK96096.1 cell wall hydrolase [Pseudomonas sp. JS3066]